jgi:integrase
VGRGRRPFVPLDPAIPHSDVTRAKACAVDVAREAVDIGATDSSRETMNEYAKRWLASRDGRVNSVRDDRGRLTNHVLPTLGALEVGTFTREDVEKLRDELDAKIRCGWSVGVNGQRRKFTWKTARNVWTVVTSMCADMVNAKRRDLRTRADDPTSNVKAPDHGGDKAKQYLYPSEFLKFVACEAVPRRWRRAVALAVYTYTRDAELRVLEFESDVNMEHGVLDITRAYNRRRPSETKGTKTDTTRRFHVEANLLPLLHALHAERDGKGLVIKLPSERAMARNLRRWLWKAGVRRPALHESTPTSKNITWHDLRATGATWMAVRGDDALKIMQRCGHRDFGTTQLYVRDAEAVREGFGEVFPPLPDELLGIGGGILDTNMAVAKMRGPNWPKTSSNWRGGRDSNAFPVSFASVRRCSVFRLIVRVPSPFRQYPGSLESASLSRNQPTSWHADGTREHPSG